MYNNKKIVMCGCHEGGYEVISYLLLRGIRIDYFVILNPDQGKKNNVSGYYDFSKLASEYNIPIYYPEKYSLKSEKDISFFETNKFDLLIQGGWQRLFPEQVLNTLSIGAIGGHGSPDFLPKGRGRSPLNWSLILGKKRFILSMFLIKPGIDDGDVFDYRLFDINEFDDIRSLYYKVSILTKRMLLDNLLKLTSNQLSKIPQKGIPSYFEKRTEQDGEICWETMDVYQIYNLIRATTHPYPGAFARIGEKKIKIWKARPFDTRITYEKSRYGEVVEKFSTGHFIINCLGGLLLIEDWSCVE